MRTGETAGSRTIALLLVAVMAACVTDGVDIEKCSSGLWCPPASSCSADGQKCYPDGCGDGLVDRNNGEVCDDGNFTDGDGCSGNCRMLDRCGDGKLDNGEVCDDGNAIDGDGCSKDCGTTDTCGDGYLNLEREEQCDEGEDGQGRDTASCDDDCTLPRCGDGNLNRLFTHPVTGLTEQCDERMSAPTCDADCTPAECGDGVYNIAAGEECDDGDNGVLTDECLDDCTRATRGDKHIWTNVEECDDGNGVNADACPDGVDGTCQTARCGDGFIQTGVEECDDPTIGNDDACPNGVGGTCQPARCGDGFVHLDSEVCDDGNDDNTDSCLDGEGDACQPSRCGDGFVRAGIETCDDGNDDKHGRLSGRRRRNMSDRALRRWHRQFEPG